MTELAHAPGTVTCRPCPIERCEWHFDEPSKLNDWAPPALVQPDADAITQCGGDVVQAAIYATLHAEMLYVDDILRAHFETHGLEEWVTEVVRLRARLPETPQPPAAAHVDRRAAAAEVARALGVGTSAIGLYARQGRIPFSFTLGGHRRFNINEVRAALDDERRTR